MVTPSHTDDFEGFYQEQTAEYGFDLAKEFQKEQQHRTMRGQTTQNFLPTPNNTLETAVDSSNTSLGFFSNSRGPFTDLPSKPTRVMLRMNAAPMAKEACFSNNQDNLFLIMSATVAATFTGIQATPPILLLTISLTVLTLGLCLMVSLGDGSFSPLSNTDTSQLFHDNFPTTSAHTTNTLSAATTTSEGTSALLQ
jgi:hypothetical protein